MTLLHIGIISVYHWHIKRLQGSSQNIQAEKEWYAGLSSCEGYDVGRMGGNEKELATDQNNITINTIIQSSRLQFGSYDEQKVVAFMVIMWYNKSIEGRQQEII